MAALLDAAALAQRILDHIDQRTTDLSDASWREPVANYRSEARLQSELNVMRHTPTAFCPAAALPSEGSYIAREAAGTPLLAVRDGAGVVRVFRNACRHRGAQVACGAGRENAFVCPYHGWTYGLDGALRHVPHEYGFPGLLKDARGLVPVEAVEHGGIVFVTQQPSPAPSSTVQELPQLLGERLQLMSSKSQDNLTNWKVSAEGFLEGYHIRATHRQTFYPVQFDNLNVIEYFGLNSRVTFPYRNIQKLRTVAPADRDVAGTLTHVYHLFPNVMIATFPQRTAMIVLEPQALGVTRIHTYSLADANKLTDERSALTRDAEFVNAGGAEDRAVVESIQRSIASGANEFFEFGRFEGAIAHFHRNLHAAVAAHSP